MVGSNHSTPQALCHVSHRLDPSPPQMLPLLLPLIDLDLNSVVAMETPAPPTLVAVVAVAVAAVVAAAASAEVAVRLLESRGTRLSVLHLNDVVVVQIVTTAGCSSGQICCVTGVVRC